MSEIPPDFRTKLGDRVRGQIAAEVRSDVSGLYAFTLPSIRAERIEERSDEPELSLSLSQIRDFVRHVQSAEVESIEIESFHPSAEHYSGCPVAVVVTKVRYNRRSIATTFRCIWVYSDGTWFSTSLGKIYFPET